MAEKKMIWKQQPGIDYTRKADALIGAVCRYLNAPTMYPTIEGIAAILGIEHVEEKPEEPAEERYRSDHHYISGG
jgi:hypothetical protein